MKFRFVLLSFLIVLGVKAQKTGTFKDERDGQVYKTVYIGNQVWMAENLNFDTTRSWCEKCEENGRIYQFEGAFAACPPGWHIPTQAEWQELFDYLGGDSLSGSRLTKWNGKDTSSYVGFNAIPLPELYDDKKIAQEGQKVAFCTSTVPLDKAYNIVIIDCGNKSISVIGKQWTHGVHVRCVKNYNDSYYPVSSKKAKTYLTKMEELNWKFSWDELNYFLEKYDSYNSSSVEFDFEDLKKRYKKAKTNDSLVYLQMVKLKDVDTTTGVKQAYLNVYTSYRITFDYLHEFFATIEAAKLENPNSISMLMKIPLLEDYVYDIQYKNRLVLIKYTYFKEKYKLE